MNLAQWWAALSEADRDHLIAHNGEPLAPDLRERVLAAGRQGQDAPAGSGLFDPDDPSTLADAVVDWVEAVANDEQPE
ncbi:hypothetical protein J2Y69_001670 [Microbacterium resistens]|uniref:Uncharacterized protein n=1 Tax=Microbacterium resistens TaxID=156977 RepID=A0ABU1SBW0_9MICO|nr:hypothetical protein [Microbacterium resistens]MDR6867071.1 hypothetical protein [Microbacterium resistens]